MARRLELFLLTIALSVASATLPHLQQTALAAEMDEKGESEAKEALRLYKQGLYEEAAKLFAKLSVDYPDMLIFERNLGACFYYLHKPEPALSNLRHYLNHKKDIAPDDKAIVDGWIAEMEKLREQNAAAAVPPAPQPATKTPQAFPSPQAKAEEAPQSTKAAVPVPLAPAAVPADVVNTPARIDVTSTPAPSDTVDQGSPFYVKWWFWGAIGVVAAGSVTAYLLATHSGTQNACSGGTLPCDAIK
jgi:tetratricopeptide (TPR) repeat protein